MAVSAIEPVKANMMFVAEGDWLLGDQVLPCHVWRSGERVPARYENCGRGDEPKQRNAQGRICIRME